jgi:hypothetical protein
VSLLVLQGHAQETKVVKPRHELTLRNVTVPVPKLAQAPTIDGKVDSAEWAGAGISPRSVPYEGDDLLMASQHRYFFGYTDDAFYMAWQIQRPKGAIEPKATIQTPDTPFWRTDDAIEFYLLVGPDKENKRSGWDYHVQWNAAGARYDRRVIPGAKDSVDVKWNGPWKTVSRTVPDFGWEGETYIPLAMLEGADKPGPGAYWLTKLCENRATPEPIVALMGFQENWFWSVDCPTLMFSGEQAVVARVLDCGAMAEASKSGLVLELVNRGAAPRTVVPKLAMYKRKANSPSTQSYLRAFDQARDRPADLAGAGKVALFVPDDKLAGDFIAENYDKVKELSEPVTLAAGQRLTLDFTTGKEAGNFLVLYDVRYAEGQAPAGERSVIAGGPLPYAVPEPLAVATRNFLLTDQSVQVRADLRYIAGWEAKGAISATLAAADKPGKALFEKKWPGEGLRSELVFDVPAKGLAPGEYTLNLQVADTAGKTLATRQQSITIPATPEWFTKPVGMTPVIPKPWTPIQVGGGNKLQFLMGEVELGDCGLPKSMMIRSVFDDKREPILRAPATFRGVVDGQPVQWAGKTVIDSKKPELVTATADATAGNVRVQTRTQWEYDGMQRVTITLSAAQGKPALSNFTLSLPLTPELTDLYQTVARQLGQPLAPSPVGTLPKDGLVHDWRPMVWLGNSRRGVEFFAENWKGWRFNNANATKTFEITNGPEGATLHVHFVKLDGVAPLTLDKPREITFGLMFTPMRTLNPKSVRSALGYFSKDVPKHQGDKLEAELSVGFNAAEVWNNYDLQGWPEFTSMKPADLKRWGANLNKHGVAVTPYSGWYIHRKASVYPMWGAEMLVEPVIDGGCGCDVVCWNSTISDAWLWQFGKAAKEVGYNGYRLDAGFSVAPCSSTKHHGISECGWIDDNGALQPSLSIFAAREGAKRMYRMFHGGGWEENGVCIIPPTQGCRFSAILSHHDAGVSAEGAERTALHAKEFDLSYYRAAINEDRRGLQMIYGPKTDTLGRDTRLGLGALHRMTPRGYSFVSQKEQSYARGAYSAGSIWLAEDWIQWVAPGVEFFGYWEKPTAALLQTGHPEVFGSFHVRRGQKLMLALFNREFAPIQTQVKIDLAKLGFTGPVYVLDPVLVEPMEIKDGVIPVTMTAEGYQLVQIASKPFDVVKPAKVSENLAPELDPSKWTAGAVPAGWTSEGKANMITAANSEIVLAGDDLETMTGIRRVIPAKAGKNYMIELEVRVECADNVYLGPRPDEHKFSLTFGDTYFPVRTLGSQLLPGQYQTMRLYYTPRENAQALQTRLYIRGIGKAFIRNIGVYEVDQVKPLFAYDAREFKP